MEFCLHRALRPKQGDFRADKSPLFRRKTLFAARRARRLLYMLLQALHRGTVVIYE